MWFPRYREIFGGGGRVEEVSKILSNAGITIPAGSIALYDRHHGRVYARLSEPEIDLVGPYFHSLDGTIWPGIDTRFALTRGNSLLGFAQIPSRSGQRASNTVTKSGLLEHWRVEIDPVSNANGLAVDVNLTMEAKSSEFDLNLSTATTMTFGSPMTMTLPNGLTFHLTSDVREVEQSDHPYRASPRIQQRWAKIAEEVANSEEIRALRKP